MNRLLDRLRPQRWPSESDGPAVQEMTRSQWAGIARRTPTYLAAYVDKPGSKDRGQQRAEWLAGLPIWQHTGSVLEAGCGCGRNLAALHRRWRHHARLMGTDVCPEAISEARNSVPDGQFEILDLYNVPGWPSTMVADAVLTSASLSHVEPTALPRVLRALMVRARRTLVLLEHFEEDRGKGRCLKGPKAWHPTLKPTSEGYCLWSIAPGRIFGSLAETFERRGWGYAWIEVPHDLQAPGATRLLVIGESVT